MKRTNIGGVTGDKVVGAQTDLAQKMSGDNPVISWEGLQRFQNLTRSQHLLFERGENPFAIPADPREVWEKIYEGFGRKPDLSKLNFTPPKSEFELWPIVVGKGMTPQLGYDLCLRLFPCWKYADGSLDKSVPTNDRNADKASYIIWVPADIEAPEKYANISANGLKSLANHVSLTLLERELLEAYYFTISGGKHLDEKNVTLCAGSRCSDGSVPGAVWGGGEFGVSWYDPDGSCSHLRSRSVVSA